MVNPADAWLVDEGAPTYWLTATLGFLGSCFFIPGVMFRGQATTAYSRGGAALDRERYLVGRMEDIVSANERKTKDHSIV